MLFVLSHKSYIQVLTYDSYKRTTNRPILHKYTRQHKKSSLQTLLLIQTITLCPPPPAIKHPLKVHSRYHSHLNRLHSRDIRGGKGNALRQIKPVEADSAYPLRQKGRRNTVRDAVRNPKHTYAPSSNKPIPNLTPASPLHTHPIFV